MSEALDILSAILLVTGTLFCVIGGIGVLRMPEFYSRLHAAGMGDTLGSALILTGLMLQAGFTLITVKLIMVLVFLYLTSPTATHALVKAAYAHGVRVDGRVGAPAPRPHDEQDEQDEQDEEDEDAD